MPIRRRPGISVLIATQNEEATLEPCVRSFLEFGDELILVDNGSSDHTKDIARDLESRHPEKVRFYDAPDLPDLYHNRQYALERSRFQWIVRGDADFIAYTSGEWNIAALRAYLLEGKRRFPPAIAVPLVNVSVDLWHTGMDRDRAEENGNNDRLYIAPALTGSRVRLYRYFPGFRFQRSGRWEATRYHLAYLALARRWPNPIWMHCTIKSDMHHFLRSERTNWRQHGDFQRFPSLKDYIRSIIEEKYGTTDFEVAARAYMERRVYPFLVSYDEAKNGPYPDLVREMMETNPVYKIESSKDGLVRNVVGLVPMHALGAGGDERLTPFVGSETSEVVFLDRARQFHGVAT